MRTSSPSSARPSNGHARRGRCAAAATERRERPHAVHCRLSFGRSCPRQQAESAHVRYRAVSTLADLDRVAPGARRVPAGSYASRRATLRSSMSCARAARRGRQSRYPSDCTAPSRPRRGRRAGGRRDASRLPRQPRLRRRRRAEWPRQPARRRSPRTSTASSSSRVSTIFRKRRFLDSEGIDAVGRRSKASRCWGRPEVKKEGAILRFISEPPWLGLARVGHYNGRQGRHMPTNGQCASRPQKGPIRRSSTSRARPVQISTFSKVRRQPASMSRALNTA